jgi:hypothetical protein
MRQKSWQMLAESHTELTISSSKDAQVEHKDEASQKVVEGPKKPAKTVRFDVGDEGEGSVQKPQPAVTADKET